jgi:pyrroline-5-carboxylate reductase
MKPIVFVGGGRITSALVEGLRRSGYHGTLVVHDRKPAKVRELRRKFKVEIEPDLAQAATRAGLLVIAVRPPDVRDLLHNLPKKRLNMVSLAAGIPLQALRTWCPQATWCRAMPSPVCRTARGLTALTWDRRMPAATRRQFRELFARVGSVLEIPESQFDAFSVVYSSSHGYHALAALSETAMNAGLDRRTALRAAAHALEDGIRYWREEAADLKYLLHEAATPGGIAATTMAAMDRAGYRRAVENGVRTGLQHARRQASR